MPLRIPLTLASAAVLVLAAASCVDDQATVLRDDGFVLDEAPPAPPPEPPGGPPSGGGVQTGAGIGQNPREREGSGGALELDAGDVTGTTTSPP